MRPLRHRLAAVLATALIASCGTAPPVDPTALLDEAARDLDDGRPADAYDRLAALDPETLTTAESQRHAVLTATALYRTDDYWDAFVVLREFDERNLYSDYAAEVERLLFAIGKGLVQRDSRLWLFGSDRDDGEIVLAHYVSRHPTAPDVAEALKLLGGIAYDEGRFLTARERYRELIADHAASEWAPLARFRNADAGFRSLVGPDYDLREMELTRQELIDYLGTNPERREFRDDAGKSLAMVTRWIAERHLRIAAFYREVGNADGELHHLHETVDEFPELEAGREAAARLRDFRPSADPRRPGGTGLTGPAAEGFDR